MFGAPSLEMDPENEPEIGDNSDLHLEPATSPVAFQIASSFQYDLYDQHDDAISALSSVGSTQPAKPRRKRTGSKRDTKLFKKKQAYSILFKYLEKKWAIRIRKQFKLTLSEWRHQGILPTDFKIKLTKTVRKDVLGLLFFPELSKNFEEMRVRIDKILCYADNFNIGYFDLLYHRYKAGDHSIKVDYSLLHELVSSIEYTDNILDEFLSMKATKILTTSPRNIPLGSSSGGSTLPQKVQGKAKLIPTREELLVGFQLLKAELTDLHSYVQGLEAACPVQGLVDPMEGLPTIDSFQAQGTLVYQQSLTGRDKQSSSL